MRRWGTPKLNASPFIFVCLFLFLFLFLFLKEFALVSSNSNACLFLTAKTRLKLKSRYKTHVKNASDYPRTIDDFNDLINPRTLARHFLGPKPSSYILCAIAREEKSKFLVFGHTRFSSFKSIIDILFLAFFRRDDNEIQLGVVRQAEG